MSNTQMALDALHDAGLKPDDPAYKAAIKFVSRLQNSSETNDQSWSGNDGGFIYSPGDTAATHGRRVHLTRRQRSSFAATAR